MNHKNTLKFSQSAIAVVALLGLIIVSATTITALNPIVEQGSSNINSGNVAGISTESNRISPLAITQDFKNDGLFTVEKLVGETSNGKTLGSLLLSSKGLPSGTYTDSFVTIYNPNNFEVKAKVKFILPQDLKGKAKIYLEDNKDSLIMYTQEQSYGPKTITLEGLSERNFRVRIVSNENITTPFESVFVFTVGD